LHLLQLKFLVFLHYIVAFGVFGRVQRRELPRSLDHATARVHLARGVEQQVDQDWVQMNLARVHAKLDVLRLMNWQSAWEATKGVLDIGHCSAIKVYGTEFYLDAFRLLFEILGPSGYLKAGTPGAVLRSRLEANYRGMLILTFGGGTNEMQRDLISMFSLGFPRAAR
jgi:alkylation response protein AidB-like acyl-CoA dehydrogenase